jgi:hypothetical protein
MFMRVPSYLPQAACDFHQTRSLQYPGLRRPLATAKTTISEGKS